MVEGGDGLVVGPMSTDAIAQGILDGALPVDVRVAAPRVNKWLRATDVPVIAALLDSEPTQARVPRTVDEPMSELPETVDAKTPRATGVVPAGTVLDAEPTTRPTPPPRLPKFDETAPSAGVARKR